MDDKRRLEQIVGTIGFLDNHLNRVSPDLLEQFGGLFRISPEKETFEDFARRLAPVDNHDAMRIALEAENRENVILCSARLLKDLLSKLEFPVLTMPFALERIDLGSEQDKAKVAATLAYSLMQAIAKRHAMDDFLAWAAASAQLFALMCHASRRSVTKMNEFALAVCLLPSISCARQPTMADLEAESKLLGGFQKSRDTATMPTRIELFITYGRRIWGVVYDFLESVQNNPEVLPLFYRDLPSQRRRTSVMAALSRPISSRIWKEHDQGGVATVKLNDMRRPSLITRAVSKSARAFGGAMVAAPPSSSMNATFLDSSTLASPSPAKEIPGLSRQFSGGRSVTFTDNITTDEPTLQKQPSERGRAPPPAFAPIRYPDSSRRDSAPLNSSQSANFDRMSLSRQSLQAQSSMPSRPSPSPREPPLPPNKPRGPQRTSTDPEPALSDVVKSAAQSAHKRRASRDNVPSFTEGQGISRVSSTTSIPTYRETSREPAKEYVERDSDLL